MTRWFCDICGAEVLLPDAQPKFATLVTHPCGMSNVDFKIIRCIDKKAWNGGHLCDGCLASSFEYAAQVLRGIDEHRGGLR